MKKGDRSKGRLLHTLPGSSIMPAWFHGWWAFIRSCFMTELLLVIFVISALLILHTYLFYPAAMILFFPKKRHKIASYKITDELPQVAVLVAAYNEEKVIGEKVISVFNTSYPLSRLKVYVGSDASMD